jgi:peptidoglycan/LPS O-acetylase OafA/YrhL
MRRNQSLDILRAIAVVSVLGFHLDYYSLWSRGGWIGIDLFFVLSGFLISGILFQEYEKTGGIKIRRFLLRRGLKIWPSYYLLLMLCSAIYVITKALTSKEQLLANLFVVQNYFPGHPVHRILVHTWTLAIEEHFYLALPFLLAFLMWRKKLVWVPAFSLTIGVLCLLFRILTLKPGYQAWATHMRIDGIFGGVMLGYFYHFKVVWFNKFTTKYSLIAAAVFILPAFFFEIEDRQMQTFGLTGLAIGFVLLVAWAVVRNPRSLLLSRVAQIGAYSYSIYLWHTIFVLLFMLWKPITVFKFWLYIASCILGGIGMAHLIEIPYLKLRERLYPASAFAIETTSPSG